MTLDEAAKIDALVDAYDDLPDGAFWAALADQGYEPEDVVEAQELLEAEYGE